MEAQAQNVNADGQLAEAGAPVVAQQQPVDPTWLNDRLARAKESARKEAIQEYGATPEEVKKALELVKSLEQEKMTETEKLRAELEALKSAKAKAESLEAVVKMNADSALQDLEEKHRASVLRIAGEDPAAQLKLIGELRASGLLSSKIEQPVTTSVSAPAPKAEPSQQESLRQKHAELLARGALLDAAYLLEAHPEIAIKHAP